jgi:hypothetical protein
MPTLSRGAPIEKKDTGGDLGLGMYRLIGYEAFKVLIILSLRIILSTTASNWGQ